MLEASGGNADIAQIIEDTLKQWHRSNSNAQLRAPGQIESIFDGFLHEEALTVVVDTNVLRNDILYACRTGRRTTLMTAANTGALRVYVPAHVMQEIDEHIEEWCLDQGCDPRTFHKRFATEYLSRILVIPHNAIPLDTLTPGERMRIENLMRRDPDDAPAAVLSLVMGAPFLTMDEAAYQAVYGEYRTYDDLQGWRETLTAGSNSAELAKWQFIAIGLPIAMGYGTYKGVEYLANRVPWALAILAVGTLCVAISAPKSAYATVGVGASKFIKVVYEIQRPYEVALRNFGALHQECLLGMKWRLYSIKAPSCFALLCTSSRTHRKLNDQRWH